MDLCIGLSLFFAFLLLVALIGHGLWLVLAAILRALRGEVPESRPAVTKRPRACVACGAELRQGVCPECRLIADSPTAHRLRDLEITAKQIQHLVDENRLETEIGAKVYAALEASQGALLGDARPAKRLRKEPAPVADWVQLDQMLAAVPDTSDLSLEQWREALGLYRRLEEEDLRRLSAHGMLLLSRLLDHGGLGGRSLHVLRLLAEFHADAPECPRVLLEGARLAVSRENVEEARWFLERAAQHAYVEAEAQELEQLRRSVPALEMVQAPVAAAVGEDGDVAQSARADRLVASIPATPSRSWGQWLGAFMEEKNILWGELVGGLLIVGCSIALVISLWQTLEQIPYFPFVIFGCITTAIFGAGFYTLSHWKLESTSRGLLVIGALLTPLDFVVLAGLSRGREAGLVDFAVELGALAFFGFLIWRAARILLAGALGKKWGEAALTLAVLGSTASQLLAPRWLDLAEPNLTLFVILSLVPVLCHAAALGMAWFLLTRRQTLSLPAAHGLLLLAGLSTFALAVALGFLAYWSTDPLTTLSRLAVPIALSVMPLIPCAGLLQERVAGGATDGESDPAVIGLSSSSVRVAGSILGLSAMAVMLATLPLAWPRPLGLALIGLFNCAVFTAFGLRYRFPQAHLPAVVCLAVAGLTGWHALAGNLDATPDSAALLASFGSAQSAVLLTLLAVLVAAASHLAHRFGRTADALQQVLGAGLLAVVGLGMIASHPDTSMERAFILGLFGVGVLAVNLRWRQDWLTWLGSLLLTGFAYWFLTASMPELPETKKWLFAALAQGTIWAAGAMIVFRWHERKKGTGTISDGPVENRPHAAWAAFGEPMQFFGMILGALALIPLCVTVRWDFLVENALCWAWLGCMWLIFAWGRREAGHFAIFQATLLLSALVAATAWLAMQPWVQETRDLFEHWWSLQTYSLVAGAVALAWTVFRKLAPTRATLQTLLEPPWPSFDRVLLGFVVIWQVAIALAALLPALGRELYSPARLGPWNDIDEHLFRLDAAWILLGITATALILYLNGRHGNVAWIGLVILGLGIPFLIALSQRELRAAASALRWASAAALLLGSLGLWMRDRLGRWRNARFSSWQSTFNLAPVLRPLLLWACVGPILLLTIEIAAGGFAGRMPPGPLEDSFFRQIGWVPSMLVPLGIVAFTFAGHGVREGSSGYVFAAGQVALVAVMGGYALGLILRGAALDEAAVVVLVQLGILAPSLWAFLWLLAWRRNHEPLLHLQVALGPLGLGVLLVVEAAILVVNPGGPHPPHLHEAGGLLGWCCLGLAIATGLWHLRDASLSLLVHGIGAGGLALGIMIACAASAWSAPGWLGYHLLTLTWTLLGIALLAAGWAGASLPGIGPGIWNPERRAEAARILGRCLPRSAVQRWVEVLVFLVVFFALRGAWNDPARPYWSCAAVSAVAVLLGAMALWTRRQTYVYLSGLGVNLLGYLLWHAWLTHAIGLQVWVGIGPGFFDRFLSVQILSLATAACIWAAIETSLRRREPAVDLRGRAFPFVHAASILAIQLLGLLIAVGLAGNVHDFPARLEGMLPWFAWGTTALALILCLRDPQARNATLPECGLFCLGVLAIGLGLHQSELIGRDVFPPATVLLAGYVAAASLLPRFQALRSDQGERWLLACQAPLAIFVLFAGFWICLDWDTAGARLLGPLALGFLTCGAALTNASWQRFFDAGAYSHVPRTLLLSLLVLLPVQTAWALLDPDIAAVWLHRLVLLLAVLTVLAGVYLSRVFGQVSKTSLWASLLEWAGRSLFALAGVVLVVVLIYEVMLYDPVRRTIPLALPGVILVAALLAGVVVFALWLALSRRNPLRLTFRGQRNLVYAAEVLVVVLFVHTRLCIPNLFPSFLARNWHFVLMTMGFLGVGLGELFRRRSVPALAEPLHRTGLFLPLIPLLAFLVRPFANFDALGDVIHGAQPILRYLRLLPEHYAIHALLWFLVALLYVSVSVLRRAGGWALAAALAANFGLWVLYAHHQDLRFLLHPQLWLIPLGVIVLCAEHLQRERLTSAQANALRYAGLLLIYLSSTADLFIAGLGNSVWLPILLAVFSVLGVLAGILLRVRAFLFLGVAFLSLVIFAQIWHAAVNRGQTWIWWASGIVLGALILTLFALFEKRRNEMLKLLDEIKHWD